MKNMIKEKSMKSSLKGLGISKTFKTLKEKGTYTLAIFVPVDKRIVIGRMGDHKFPKGYYAYTGSAFGKSATSLKERILRHLRKGKKKRWHIDYLLSGDNAAIMAIIATPTKEKMECEINRYLRDKLKAEIPVPKFGSSDCKEKCGSHLLYLGADENVVKRITKLYSEKINADIYPFYFRCLFDA